MKRDEIYVTEFGDWGMFGRVRVFDTKDWTGGLWVGWATGVGFMTIPFLWLVTR